MPSGFRWRKKLQRMKHMIGELCKMGRVIVVRARKIAVVHAWARDLSFSFFALCTRTRTRHALLLSTPLFEGINHTPNP
jgi:hypothetical protein